MLRSCAAPWCAHAQPHAAPLRSPMPRSCAAPCCAPAQAHAVLMRGPTQPHAAPLRSPHDALMRSPMLRPWAAPRSGPAAPHAAPQSNHMQRLLRTHCALNSSRQRPSAAPCCALSAAACCLAPQSLVAPQHSPVLHGVWEPCTAPLSGATLRHLRSPALPPPRRNAPPPHQRGAPPPSQTQNDRPWWRGLCFHLLPTSARPGGT